MDHAFVAFAFVVVVTVATLVKMAVLQRENSLWKLKLVFSRGEPLPDKEVSEPAYMRWFGITAALNRARVLAAADNVPNEDSAFL